MADGRLEGGGGGEEDETTIDDVAPNAGFRDDGGGAEDDDEVTIDDVAPSAGFRDDDGGQDDDEVTVDDVAPSAGFRDEDADQDGAGEPRDADQPETRRPPEATRGPRDDGQRERPEEDTRRTAADVARDARETVAEVRALAGAGAAGFVESTRRARRRARQARRDMAERATRDPDAFRLDQIFGGGVDPDRAVLGEMAGGGRLTEGAAPGAERLSPEEAAARADAANAAAAEGTRIRDVDTETLFDNDLRARGETGLNQDELEQVRGLVDRVLEQAGPGFSREDVQVQFRGDRVTVRLGDQAISREREEFREAVGQLQGFNEADVSLTISERREAFLDDISQLERGTFDQPAGDPRSSIERQLERQLAEETGEEVDLDPDTDIEFVREDGQLTGRLSQAGVDKVETAGLTATVEAAQGVGIDIPEFETVRTGPGPGGLERVPAEPTRVELGDLPAITIPEFGPREVTPGPGAGTREVVDVQRVEGPVVEDVNVQRDFGDLFGSQRVITSAVRKPTPGRGAGPLTEVETASVDEALVATLEAIDASVEASEPTFEDIDPGRAGAAGRVEAREFDEGQGELVRFGAEKAIEFVPTVIVGAGKLGVDVADFGAELIVESVDPAEFERVPGEPRGIRQTEGFGLDFDAIDRLTSDAVQVAANQAAVGASGAIEEPGRAVAAAAATLPASALTFGAASAIGARTGLAARFAIQPGEEIAGIGGFGVTRRVAGRGAAERLFPNREPLIFSEEFAIRQARRAARGARARVPSVEVSLPDRPAIGDIRVGAARGELQLEDLFEELRFEAAGPPELTLVEFGPFEIEEGEGFGDTFDPPDVDADEGGVSVGGPIEIERVTDSGVVVERVRQPTAEAEAPEAEFDIEAETAAETGFDLDRRRFEIAFDPVGLEGVTAEAAAGEGLSLDPLEALDLEGIEAEFPRLDFEIEGLELEAEFEGERPRSELALRQEREQELEILLELEGEREPEVERFGGRERERFDRLDRLFGRPAASAVFVTDIPTPSEVEAALDFDDGRGVEAPGVEAADRRTGGIDPDFGNLDIEVDNVDIDLDDIDPFE